MPIPLLLKLQALAGLLILLKKHHHFHSIPCVELGIRCTVGIILLINGLLSFLDYTSSFLPSEFTILMVGFSRLHMHTSQQRFLEVEPKKHRLMSDFTPHENNWCKLGSLGGSSIIPAFRVWIALSVCAFILSHKLLFTLISFFDSVVFLLMESHKTIEDIVIEFFGIFLLPDPLLVIINSLNWVSDLFSIIRFLAVHFLRFYYLFCVL